MKRVNPPPYTSVEIFSRCLEIIENPGIRGLLESIIGVVESSERSYVESVIRNGLDGIARQSNINGTVNKAMLLSLYKEGVVRKSGPCRGIYDYIMSLPSGSVCPYCLVSVATTLDHVLPKDSYPIFSVSPCNLVACCADCNKAKGKRIVRSVEDHIIHPYFYDIPNEKWLHAEILKVRPLSLRFFVSAPTYWDTNLINKVTKHFSVFKLARLFSIYSAQELSNKRHTLNQLFEAGQSEALSSYLLTEAESRRVISINSWQTALYETLATDAWFLEEGVGFIAGPQTS